MEEYRIAISELMAKDYKYVDNHIDSMTINHYPWDANGYKPNAECRVVCCADGLKVRMEASEKEITATYSEMNDPVYKDSCLEFFVSPFQDNPDYYFNFELNPLGTLLLGRGSKQLGRERINIENFKEYFQIKSEKHKGKGDITHWLVEFTIPYQLLKEHQSEETGVIGQRMRGNFYKCGDETKYPHYGCWSRIDIHSPKFHSPQFFGNLVLPEGFIYAYNRS